MQRLYYLTDSVSSVLSISRDLDEAGIGDNRLHVMGQSNAVLNQAHVHTTTPLEETDLMPFGFTGALAGLALGALFGFLLAIMDPWTMELGGSAVLVGAAFFACFGAWLGGLFYDMTGSYTIVWGLAIALGLMAAGLHAPIADAPMRRPAAAQAG